jgi:hypothetical protein
MVLQYNILILRSQRIRKIDPLFLREHRAAEPLIHRQIIIEITHILEQHLNRLPERRPRDARGRVQMHRDIDVWPHLVQHGMDDEARVTDGVMRLLLDGAFLIDQHKVGDFDEAEMHRIGICTLGKLGQYLDTMCELGA